MSIAKSKLTQSIYCGSRDLSVPGFIHLSSTPTPAPLPVLAIPGSNGFLNRPAPIMLENLPIIHSGISQNLYLLFFTLPPIIPKLFCLIQLTTDY